MEETHCLLLQRLSNVKSQLASWSALPRPRRNYAPHEAPPEGQGPGAVLEVEPDPTSLHTGCPVLEGEKWVATRWVRSAEFH